MAAPAVQCPGVSDTGAYRVAWTDTGAPAYRLVETDPGGAEQTLYEGDELASTVSGRAAGSYRYRVGVAEAGSVATWSDPCVVDVSPPSIGLALSLFGVGLVVCLATVVAVLRGHRAHRRGEIG